MTDRELLELAAKAAGLTVIREHVWGNDFFLIVKMEEKEGLWNPLAIDGDALRLAMKLRLYVYVGSMRTAVSSWSLGMEPEDAVKEDFSDSTDEAVATATRRAIVRAAAEIGKEMRP